MKKRISILLVLVMVLSMIPMAAFAVSVNTVNKVVGVPGTYTFNGDVEITVAENPSLLNHFKNGEVFEIILPENTEWDTTTAAYEANTVVRHTYGATTATAPTVKIRTKRIMEIQLNDNDDASRDVITIPLFVKAAGATGDLSVEIRALDSSVSSGTVTFAKVGQGSTTTTVDSVPSFERTTPLGAIRIDENSIGALKDGAQNVTLYLPPNFSWDTSSIVLEYSGGLSGNVTQTPAITGNNERKLIIPVTVTGPRTARGSIFIKGLQVRADRTANYGDVEVQVDGTNVTSEDLVMAKYAEYGSAVKVEKVAEVVAGRKDSVNRTAKITIEEAIPGSFIVGREVVVVLPTWVKVANMNSVTSSADLAGVTANFNTARNEFYFTIPTGIVNTSKSKFEFKLDLSVEAFMTGDIEATVSGAGVASETVVIAEAVAPVTIETKVTDFRLGVQHQAAAEMIITETKAGRILDAAGSNITITLPAGFAFSTQPKVEVLEGNGELNLTGITALGGRTLTIPVKSSSTRAMVIKVSGITATLDRTLAEGAGNALLGGSALVTNNSTTTPDFNNLLSPFVKAFQFSNVITPAPGEVRTTAKFTIGQNTFTTMTDGVEVVKVMDVAAFINVDGRTMLPVRYVAEALGVSENNIIWNAQARTVTIFKGDRVAQMTIGNNILTINGVQMAMDTSAQIVDGRTVLPLRYVAQALGAEIEWDAVNYVVTVKQ